MYGTLTGAQPTAPARSSAPGRPNGDGSPRESGVELAQVLRLPANRKRTG
jgi:hypothetical protein